MRFTPWTEQEKLKLQELRDQKKMTFEEIGRKLHKSRSSIAGQIRRGRLSKVPELAALTASWNPPRPPRPPAFGVAEAVQALHPDDCHWPLGEPSSDSFRFCCEPIDPFSRPPYCEEHRVIARTNVFKGASWG